MYIKTNDNSYKNEEVIIIVPYSNDYNLFKMTYLDYARIKDFKILIFY